MVLRGCRGSRYFLDVSSFSLLSEEEIFFVNRERGIVLQTGLEEGAAGAETASREKLYGCR